MSTGQDEFVTIRPRQVALSRTNDAPGSRRPRVSIGRVLAAAGVALLIAVSAWVFVYLPGHVAPIASREPATAQTPPAEGAASNATAPAAPAAPPQVTGPAPYEAIQIERERKRAQDTLARFVKLQIELDEQMHVRNWAVDPFNAAQQLANDGDALFTQQKFDAAIANYERGIAAL